MNIGLIINFIFWGFLLFLLVLFLNKIGLFRILYKSLNILNTEYNEYRKKKNFLKKINNQNKKSIEINNEL